jgi:hypothetical protein
MTWLIALGCATHGDLNDDLGGGTSDGSCVGNQARQCQRGLWEPGTRDGERSWLAKASEREIRDGAEAILDNDLPSLLERTSE